MSDDHGPIYGQSKLQIIFAITLLGVMAVSLLSPAFPSIRDHFGVTENEVGLLITAFTLPGIFLSFFIGSLADWFGRKQVLVPALFLFGVAGGACAIAPDFSTLIILRFFQGIGGAALVTLAVTLIGDYYDGIERASAIGANASVLSIGTASYPFLGGVLTEFSWVIPFLLYLLAIPVGIIALFFLRNPEQGDFSIHSYLHQISRLIIKPRTLGAMVASALAFIMLYGGIITYFPQLMNERFTHSPLTIGAIMGSMSIAVAIISSQTGKLVKRFPMDLLIITGFFLYGVGLFLIPLIPQIWIFLVPMIIFGFGHGLILPNLQTLFSRLAAREHRGAMMSLFNISTRTGMTIGPLILALSFAVGGFSMVFRSAALLSLIASGIGILVVKLK
ncbi:hypothetical protein AKJ48_02060 [candidate division MSBL1 archaeon SCGC-AAA261O19]|uniref:Major facilitator superfamily (MFS) profile domain-containing protein n=1 Tax=candidate division MSBL1 archaeon SCGC-AAA261O19 TaxID=1698277 RepID=A0A133VDT0_9EURY|nr:hypothetical protein AKJ48_02060 [candidate division MSBL1 archaeon SCGC-AAA261O19]